MKVALEVRVQDDFNNMYLERNSQGRISLRFQIPHASVNITSESDYVYTVFEPVPVEHLKNVRNAIDVFINAVEFVKGY